jgi:hypothetical protein
MKHLFDELTTNFPTNKICTLIWAETGLADTVYIIREGQDYPTCNNHVFDRHGLFIKSFTGPLPYHIMGDRPLTMENRERIINEMYLFGVPVEIKYEDGSKEITRVNGTADTIKKHFAIGKPVNIGNGPLDNIQKITEVNLSF